MEQIISIIPEQAEQIITPIFEPFLLTKSQSKTVELNMVDGNQIVIPDAGYLIQSVTVVKPTDLIPDNIKKDAEIGGVVGSYEGVVLPTLDNPANADDVFAGYEYIDSDGNKQTGEYSFPTLNNEASSAVVFSGYDFIDADGVRQEGAYAYPVITNPATASDVFSGKEYLDGQGIKRTGEYAFPVLSNEASADKVFSGYDFLNGNGIRVEGNFSYPTLTDGATSADVFNGKDFIDANGERKVGSFAYPTLTTPAQIADVVNGKEYIDENGNKQTGTLNPDLWASSFLCINHVSVTVTANSVNTTIGVRDWLLQASGVDANRLLAFVLREKPSYVNGEIGRAVIYQNSSIGYFTVMQYTNGAWGTGRMLSGYSATLPVGSVYDIYYWSLP